MGGCCANKNVLLFACAKLSFASIDAVGRQAIWPGWVTSLGFSTSKSGGRILRIWRPENQKVDTACYLLSGFSASGNGGRPIRQHPSLNALPLWRPPPSDKTSNKSIAASPSTSSSFSPFGSPRSLSCLCAALYTAPNANSLPCR